MSTVAAAAPIPPDASLLTAKQVCVLAQIPRRTLGYLVSGGRFPKPISLGDSTVRQAHKRWVRAEVDAWIAKRMEQR